MASGDTKTESYLRAAAEGTRADLPADSCCNTKTQNLILGVANRIMDVEDEVERLENNPDVVDIVATYADLQAYDTGTLTDKDIIRVLEDSTHNNNSTYYRWNATTNQFDFVGEISGGSSVNVVQTTGTSTTDVMSQDATTKMITRAPNQTAVNILSESSYGLYSIAIGNHAVAYQLGAIAIGGGSSSSNAAYTTSIYTIAIGSQSKAQGNNAVAIGYGAAAREESTSLGHEAGAGGSANAKENVYLGHQAGKVTHSNKNSVALGHYAQITRDGEVSVGASSGTSGYAGTSYRVIGNVHDGQDAHDAVTVEQVNATIDAINAALSTSIPHIGA